MSETPKNKKGGPVFGYLAIMFAVAFLMLLLAYFIQQRNNEVAMDGLRDSITSFESIDELLEENRQLRENADALQEEISALEEDLENARSEYSQLEESYHRAQGDCSNEHDYAASWEVFWSIEQLYQRGHYTECADTIKALAYSTFYLTPEAAQPRADEIWNALMGMGLLTEEDAFANCF